MADWVKKEYGDVFTLTHNPKYPVPKYEDFIDFKNCLYNDDGWQWNTNKPDRKVLCRDNGDGSVLQIKMRSMELKDIPCDVIHDVLQDPEFRTEWDDSMKEQFLVEQVDENTEIGYYSVKMPMMISNRDWVNMRSWWFDVEKGEYIIMNHSVEHDNAKPKKGFVRANSLKTGYMVMKKEEGTEISYFAWNAWNGAIPNFCINFLTKTLIGNVIESLRKACLKYPEWKEKRHPEEKYWMKEGEVIQQTKGKK